MESVTIKRFRSLFDVGPLTIQSGLTVLTGENDGGKSTCLDAIAFLLGAYAVDEQDRCHDASDEDPIEVEGRFFASTDLERASPVRIRAVQPCKGTKSTEVLDRVHSDFDSHPSAMTLQDIRRVMSTLEIESPGGSAKAPIQSAAEQWIASRPDTEFHELWRPAAKADMTRLPRLTRFTSADAQNPTSILQSVVAREARRLIAEPKFAVTLASVAQDLDRDIAPSLQRVKERIEQHCADIDTVEIKASFDFSRATPQVTLQLVRQGREIDLSKAGQGRLRRVTLAVHEANLRALEDQKTETTEILAYDEPDTHLDYSAQRLLFDILDRQARIGNIQVIAATHSKNFIDMSPLEAIHHFRLNEELLTIVDTLAGASHEEELAFQAAVCAGLGLRNSMLLDERCFIIIEGDTEDGALPLLYPMVTGRTLVGSGINLVNTRGSGAARIVVTMLKKQWGKDVILLLDADARTERQDWLTEFDLDEGSGLYFIGTNEFEDAFDDQTWYEVLSNRFEPKDNGAPWTLADVSSLRSTEKFSESLHRMVRRRCRDNSISKPDIGLALAGVCSTRSDVPEVLCQCFEYARAISGRP